MSMMLFFHSGGAPYVPLAPPVRGQEGAAAPLPPLPAVERLEAGPLAAPLSASKNSTQRFMQLNMNSMQTCNSVTFYLMKKLIF